MRFVRWGVLVGALVGTLAMGLVPRTQAGAQAAQSTATPVVQTDHQHEYPQGRGWRYHGDLQLRRALVAAAARATGQTPQQVRDAVRAGRSIAEVATAGGKATDDVLAIYDQMVADRFAQAVERGRLPEHLAESRTKWFQAAGRQMINQPGLAPAYPGLHELHGTIIGTAARVSGLQRSAIREQLYSCRTLNDILAGHGHSGAEAVAAALGYIDAQMDALVQAGRLSTGQRQSWHDAINAALTRMVETPGLHVAGKQCS